VVPVKTDFTDYALLDKMDKWEINRISDDNS